MATRFYFQSSAAVPISPTISATWQESAALVRSMCSPIKQSSAMASTTVTSTATTPELHCAWQFMSDPLEAQTVSGTVKAQFRCSESNANFNGNLQVGIRIIRDNLTVVGTPLAVTGSTTTTSTPPEFATSLTNRRLLTAANATPLTLTSVACLAGDRLVIEVGVNDKDSGSVRTASVNIGDDSGTDLAEDDTTTAANNPWLEFSGTLTFMDVRRPTFDDGVIGPARTHIMVPSGTMPGRGQ